MIGPNDKEWWDQTRKARDQHWNKEARKALEKLGQPISEATEGVKELIQWGLESGAIKAPEHAQGRSYPPKQTLEQLIIWEPERMSLLLDEIGPKGLPLQPESPEELATLLASEILDEVEMPRREMEPV